MGITPTGTCSPVWPPIFIPTSRRGICVYAHTNVLTMLLPRLLILILFNIIYLEITVSSSWFSFYLQAVNQERFVTYTKKDKSPVEIKPEEWKNVNIEEKPTETADKAEFTENTTESGKKDEKIEKKEWKEDEIAILDERGRVGPNFEVQRTEYHEHTFDEEPRVPVKVEQVSSLDMNLFEKEELPIIIEESRAAEVRLLLQNYSLLQEPDGERHRDLGSSFILPVMNMTKYDNNTVPVAFTDVPVHVTVQLNVLHLANFDSELMEFSIDVEMKLTWFDLRLANNYSQPIRIRELPLLQKTWRPDPYIVNSKHSHFHLVSFPNFRMRIFPNGLVTYTMRITSICNCFMFFCLYPHDRQTCDMKISSIAYPDSFVRFHWHKKPISFETPIALPELQVRSLRTEECGPIEGKLIRSSCLRLVFELERDGARFIVEKYIPSTLAMMFAWVAPYVPYNYEDVRIVTPITVLLTLVQMEKGENELRTSYLTSLDVWFAAMKCFTVLSLVESLIVLALIKRSRAMEKNSAKASNELERLQFRRSAKRLNWLYHQLDAVCRLLSPIVFVGFFAYYCLFVVQGDEGSCTTKREMMRRR